MNVLFQGAGVGMISSFIVSMWISVGAILNPTTPITLPLGTDQCPVPSFTSTYNSTITVPLTTQWPSTTEEDIRNSGSDDGYIY